MMDKKERQPVILVVDDKLENLSALSQSLKGEGYTFAFVQTGKDALDYLARKHVDLVLLDLLMPGMSGEETLEYIRARYFDLPVIIVTETRLSDTIVKCMKNGADDYLTKPLDQLRTKVAVRQVLQTAMLKIKYEAELNRTIINPEAFSSIATHNEQMIRAMGLLSKYAQNSYPILITGDTGSGKELFARAVHDSSGRSGEICSVNVAGIDDNMFSDTLFGHIAGAFTGADNKRDGLIKHAANGTLFMDEMGDLSPSSQIKLLRLMQEEEYSVIGDSTTHKSDARIVMATNRKLPDLEADPNFREDLYYRVVVQHVHVPPLRERLDDIPVLFESLLNKTSAELGIKCPSYSPQILSLLKTYSFPGNVRELEQMIRSVLAVKREERLLVGDFQTKVPNSFSKKPTVNDDVEHAWIRDVEVLPGIKEMQCILINEAMRRADGSMTNAGKLINMKKSALSQRLKAMSED